MDLHVPSSMAMQHVAYWGPYEMDHNIAYAIELVLDFFIPISSLFSENSSSNGVEIFNVSRNICQYDK